MDPFMTGWYGMCGSWVGALAEQAREEMGPGTSKSDRLAARSKVDTGTPRRPVLTFLHAAWQARRQRGGQGVASPLH